MAMEAAERALNESYILAEGLKKKTLEGNAALQQCIDVFADALENVNTSMSLVAAMDDDHNPGADVQTLMSAALTNHDTCQEGIDEVGPFPGCDQITGKQSKHVDTMLSIALTFVNHLTTSTTEPDRHHRRLLLTKSTGSERRRGLLSLQFLSRFHHSSQ
jgi:pectinesterase inhibitor-like protein